MLQSLCLWVLAVGFAAPLAPEVTLVSSGGFVELWEEVKTRWEGSGVRWRSVNKEGEDVVVVKWVKRAADHLQCLLPGDHKNAVVEKKMKLTGMSIPEDVEGFLTMALERPAPHPALEPPRECAVVQYQDLTKKIFIEEYVKKSRPVIIRGAPTLQWDLSSLESRLENTPLHVKVSPGGVFEGPEDILLWEDPSIPAEIPPHVSARLESPDRVITRPAVVDITMGELLRRLEEGGNSSFYLEYTNLAGFKELGEEVLPPPFAGDLKVVQKNVWLGGATLGKLHFDPYENLMSVITGGKNFTLFHPHQNERLYEGHIREGFFGFNGTSFTRDDLPDTTALVMSPVHINDPTDLTRYPLFHAANASRLHCPTTPGDTLYVPSFWWHEVASSGPYTLATNIWFKPVLTKRFPCKTCRLGFNAADYPRLR